MDQNIRKVEKMGRVENVKVGTVQNRGGKEISENLLHSSWQLVPTGFTGRHFESEWIEHGPRLLPMRCQMKRVSVEKRLVARLH
jgi:hypothetical protein